MRWWTRLAMATVAVAACAANGWAQEPSAEAGSEQSAEPEPAAEPTLSPAERLARDSEDIVIVADDTHQQLCADTAAASVGPANSEVIQNQAQLLDVRRRVVEQYNKSGHSFLLYWSGVLSECLGQAPSAAYDLALFVELERYDENFAAMVKDATRRLRRMDVDVEEFTPEEVALAKERKAAAGEVSLSRDAPALRRARGAYRVPFLLIDAGGGYQRLGPWNYAAISANLSFGVVGPLRVEVGARPGWALSEQVDGETVPSIRTILVPIHISAAIELPAVVRPRFGLGVQVAPNIGGLLGPNVYVGVHGHVGVDVPLGNPAVALRFAGELGNLDRQFVARGTAGVVVGIARPRR